MKRTIGLIVFSLLIMGLLLPPLIFGGGSVAGRYTVVKGKDITLNLYIASPPPSTLIVEQFLPKGNTINQAEPSPKKFDPKSGEAKWLLKGVQAGTIVIHLNMVQDVEVKEVKAVLRFREQSNGKMIQIEIMP